jgi:hypothetical protein
MRVGGVDLFLQDVPTMDSDSELLKSNTRRRPGLELLVVLDFTAFALGSFGMEATPDLPG